MDCGRDVVALQLRDPAPGATPAQQRADDGQQQRYGSHGDADDGRLRVLHPAYHRHVEQHQAAACHSAQPGPFDTARPRERARAATARISSTMAASAYRTACTVNSGAPTRACDTATLLPTQAIPTRRTRRRT
ncbi:MAG TPA: hypothetical protein VNA67_02960 [Pseudonocardiaceae bacterium]|nr:hypothetical protein [Pseudonocardiaceae bacterium]